MSALRRAAARLRAAFLNLAAGAALALTAAAGPAAAQAPAPCVCHPFQNDADWFALVVSYNIAGGPGPWLHWACYPQKIPPGATVAPPPRHCAVASTWSSIDLRRLGDRVETIRQSPDPRAAFAASWKRHVTLPLSHPSLQGVVDAMKKKESAP